MPDEDANDVLFERADGLLTITLNRPDARNALNKSMSVKIEEAIDDFEATDELFVAIITGAGGNFCSGMDLKAFLRGESPRTDKRGLAGMGMKPPTKPIIAAVEGYALAGGFEVVLACDLIVAASNAKFGLPETKRGLCAAGGGLFRLPDRIPYHQAMELILTGEMFTAERANELGLINRLAEPGEALAEAQKLAAALLANGPLALKASKQVIVESRAWLPEDRFTKQTQYTDPVRASEDAKEGATAFAEKRPPVWKGR